MAESATPARILLVRNNPDARELGRLIAERLAGVEVRYAENVAAVAALVKALKPAAVLVYADSPRGDAHRLVERLKGSRKATLVPVVVLANRIDVGYELRCQGATAYVERPVDLAELLRLIEPLSRGRRRVA